MVFNPHFDIATAAPQVAQNTAVAQPTDGALVPTSLPVSSDAGNALPTANPQALSSLLNASLVTVSDHSPLQVVRDIYNPFTIIPDRPRSEVIQYTAVQGDTIYTIADRFKLKPETIAWSNIRRYIEGSLTELAARNTDLRTNYRAIDANRFTAVIYRGGNKVTACTISLGAMMGDILYSSTENARDNSCNESLSVNSDDQSLFLEPMGMSMMYRGGNNDKKLSLEGGAELFWAMLMEPLQRG